MKRKECVCGKKQHISEGAAEAQIRALKKLQTLEEGKKDFKNTGRLHCYRSKACEAYIKDGNEVWHVGHR